MIFQTRKRISNYHFPQGTEAQNHIKMIELLTEKATDEFMTLYSEQVEKEMKRAIIKAMHVNHDVQYNEIIVSAQVDVNLLINPIVVNEIKLEADSNLLDTMNDAIFDIRRNNIPYNEVE